MRCGLNRVAAGAALVAVCLAVGCGQGATEILIAVDTDLTIPGEIDLITAQITDPGGEVRTSDARFGVDEPPLPRTLGLVHEGGPLGPYDVIVRGLLGGTEIVSRSARVEFVSGEIRVLRMFLVRSCVGVTCDAGMSCDETGCRSVTVPEAELPLWTGDIPRLDGPDAGPPDDGGMDAAVDAGVDSGGGDSGSDAGTDAGPPVDAGPCPAVCTGGCDVSPGRCNIIGTTDVADIFCPPGFTCSVDCAVDGSCPGRIHCAEDGSSCDVECGGVGSCARSTDCESAAVCNIRCTGNGSCAGNNNCKDSSLMCTILCDATDSCAGRQECRASGPCTVTCSGDNTCAGLGRCETAACSHTCSGSNSCTLGIDCMTSCACAVNCTGTGSCATPPICPTGCDDAAGCRGSGSGCNTCP